MVHPELGPVALIASFLAIIPLPAQIRARSIPTIALSLWLSIVALTKGVNAIVWSDNTDIKLEIWGEIVTRLHHCFVFAVPGAAMCIMIQLETIASTRAARMTMEDKRRKKMFEVFICFILPLLMLPIYYIDQGHRYDIWEGFGPLPVYYGSIVSLLFAWLPPLFMSLVSLFFGSKVVYHFIHHRITFMTYLNTCPSSISVSRYIRLMALSSVEVFWELAANIYVLYFNLKLNGLPAYRNWAWVHFDFNRIDRNPRFLVPDNVFEAFLITWWIIPSACFAFFLFFGTGEEALKDYRNVINLVRVHIFRQKIVPKSTHSQFGSLPSHSFNSRSSTVKTAVSPIYNDKFSKKPWDDLEIQIPDIPDSPSDTSSLAPSYKTDPTVAATPIAVTVTPAQPEQAHVSEHNSSRFSTGSDLGITVSELRSDSRQGHWPSDISTPPSPTTPVQLVPSRFASASAAGIRVTIEKDVV